MQAADPAALQYARVCRHQAREYHTTDQPGELAQAARQYGIRTPMLADPSTHMSAAYGMLARGGMEHEGQDGHAFMLLDEHGRIVWQRAYPEMYVPTSQLLHDMGATP